MTSMATETSTKKGSGDLSNKTGRESFLVDPIEEALITEAVNLYIQEKGYRSKPKRGPILRDMLLEFADTIIKRNAPKEKDLLSQ